MVHATVLERKQEAAARARMAKRKGRITLPPRLKPKAPIREDETYPLALVPELFGLSRFTLRDMQRRGLRCAKVGAHKFVSGKELRRYIDELSEVQATET